MKNVWFVNHSSHTPDTGTWTRHYHLGRHLVDHGIRTRVVTASVDRHGVRQTLEPGEDVRHVEHDGFYFSYLRTPEYTGHGPGRIRNMLAFAWRTIGRAPHDGLEAPDVVVGCTVHPFAAWAGQRLAARYGVPFFFEVRDLWPETLIQFGLTGRRSPFALALGLLERHLYRRADRIVSTLPNIGLYLRRKGMDDAKVRWITNGIDFSALPPYQPPPRRDGFRVLYVGSLAYSYGLETLVDAMVHLRDVEGVTGGIELHLLGDGELRPELERRVREHGLDSVEFLGRVTRDEVPAIAEQADAFVIVVRDLPELYCYGISMNKLTEYLAIGRPIVISVGERVNNMVEEAGAGLTVEPENAPQLARAFATLAAMDPEDRRTMGERGREFAREHLDYARLAEKYARVVDEVSA